MYAQIKAADLRDGDILKNYGEIDTVRCCRKHIHVNFINPARKSKKLNVGANVQVVTLTGEGSD